MAHPSIHKECSDGLKAYARVNLGTPSQYQGDSHLGVSSLDERTAATPEAMMTPSFGATTREPRKV
jgi:hypothetical protein